ncbi:MAG: hypothetical protein AB7G34_03805, partial [Hyphomicrobiales bacterium]
RLRGGSEGRLGLVTHLQMCSWCRSARLYRRVVGRRVAGSARRMYDMLDIFNNKIVDNIAYGAHCERAKTAAQGGKPAQWQRKKS